MQHNFEDKILRSRGAEMITFHIINESIANPKSNGQIAAAAATSSRSHSYCVSRNLLQLALIFRPIESIRYAIVFMCRIQSAVQNGRG